MCKPVIHIRKLCLLSIPVQLSLYKKAGEIPGLLYDLIFR